MPSVDPKPNHRPFRRVLYREDSKDSTIIKDVSPQSDGHLLSKLKDDHTMIMTNENKKLLIKEGILYKPPIEQIKYVKHIGNDPMSRYLFNMNKLHNSRLGVLSRYESNSLP
jgi:hypothetical protein